MVATYDFLQTRDQIIKRALRMVGVLADGDTPTTDQTNNAADALNAMIKRWQNEHIFMWTLTDYTVNTVAGTAVYDVSAQNFCFVQSAFIRDASNSDLELMPITYSEYLSTYNKTNRGMPTHFAYDMKLSDSVYLYLNPDAVYSLHLIGIKLLADFDASGDSPDAGSNWIDAITYGLAESLADEYPVTQGDKQMLMIKAKTYKEDAKKADSPRSGETFMRGAY
jgi:hypothetical protein